MNAFRFLGMLGILLALTATATAAPVFTNGLVTYYGFDDSGNLAADGSGNGYNGSITGAVSYAAGKYGGAAYLTNATSEQATDYIDLPGADIVADGNSPSSNFTLAAWCKIQTPPAGGGLLELFAANKYARAVTVTVDPVTGEPIQTVTNSGTPNIQVELRPYDGTPDYRLVLRDGGTTVPSGSTPPATITNITDSKTDNLAAPEFDVWHHVAVTYDKGANGLPAKAVNMYIDGKSVLSADVTNALDMGSWAAFARIGGTCDNAPGVNPVRPYTGLVDEFYVFNRTLSGAEIKQLVPEPSSIALLIVAGLSALAYCWRKR